MTQQSQITRAKALVDRIAAETRAETDQILDAARAEADRVVHAARKKARLRVRVEVERLRRDQQEALRREEARLDTQRRIFRQREASAIIEAGLPALRDALAALWADAETRQGWITALVARADAQFGQGKWCAECGEGWGDDETDSLIAAVQGASGQRPDIRTDPDIRSGLRLRSGSAVIDGTLAALMGNPKTTGAALLAAIEEIKENGHE